MRRITKARIKFVSLVPRGANGISTIYKREFTEGDRKHLASTGAALPDGSYPIENVADLHNAIRSIGRAKNPTAARKHIIARAKALDAVGDLPASWGIAKEDGRFDLATVSKFDDEKGELLAVVYSPELRDSQGDIASADVIKDAMYEAAKAGEAIDIRHNGRAVPKDKAYVVERFIIQKGDPRFADMTDYEGSPVDVAGGWGTVIKIDDPELRELYRNGEWGGVSMGGTATVVAEKDAVEDQRGIVAQFLDGLRDILGLKKSHSDNGDLDMTDKELETILAKSNDALVDKLAGAIAKALKGEETVPVVPGRTTPTPKADEAPVFKGDPRNPVHVKKHAAAVRAFKERQEIDWSDPDAVDAYVAKLEEGGDPNQDRIAHLEAELAKAKGTSNQSPADGVKNTMTAVEKANEDITKRAIAAANQVNAQRGYKISA